MSFKDELIGEISDNMSYEEILDMLKMTDDVNFVCDAHLNDLSNDELIEMFEEYCYNFEDFLNDYEIEECFTNSSQDFGA